MKQNSFTRRLKRHGVTCFGWITKTVQPVSVTDVYGKHTFPFLQFDGEPLFGKLQRDPQHGHKH